MERVIEIVGNIDDQMADMFEGKIRELSAKGNDPILLVISSHGGYEAPMIRIIEQIKACSAIVNGRVRDYAHSAGFVILQYCKERRAPRDSSLLLHLPRYEAADITRMVGFPAEEACVIEGNEFFYRFLDYLGGRSNLNRFKLRELAREDRVILGAEALALGFLDCLE